MSDTETKQSADTEAGKFFLFVEGLEPEHEFQFSSTLEGIGINYDCRLKNFTRVLVLSDPISVESPRHGPLLVTQIMAHTIMWVRSASIVEIDA